MRITKNNYHLYKLEDKHDKIDDTSTLDLLFDEDI